MPSRTQLQETAFWMLTILGAAALVYDIHWYGELIARMH